MHAGSPVSSVRHENAESSWFVMLCVFSGSVFAVQPQLAESCWRCALHNSDGDPTLSGEKCFCSHKPLQTCSPVHLWPCRSAGWNSGRGSGLQCQSGSVQDPVADGGLSDLLEHRLRCVESLLCILLCVMLCFCVFCFVLCLFFPLSLLLIQKKLQRSRLILKDNVANRSHLRVTTIFKQ